jgi:hypothetical protein
MASTTATADGRVESRIENYTQFWKKDTSKEQDTDNANRLESYTDVVNGAPPPRSVRGPPLTRRA